MVLTRGDAAHLARRTGFGVTHDRLGRLLGSADRDAAVDAVLDTSSTPTDLLSPALTPLLPALDGAQVDLLQQWWVERMFASPAPLAEKLTLFWHGHFATGQDKVQDIALLYGQNTTIRRLALGSFHELAQAMAVDPAMLVYLDNHANVAESVQENFGRELLEAFTVGPEGRDEADVVAMSRAWTGHSLDFGRFYRFKPNVHDNGDKVLFGLPPRNWDGPAALTETLFGRRAETSSRFVTAKLFSYLAYPVTPDDEVVGRIAAEFRRADLSIRALVGAILRSDEFWSAEARYALVRSPMEWVVSVLQAIALPALLGNVDVLRRLGHEPFNPPNVFGWRGQGAWVSSSAVWAKAEWLETVTARAVTQGYVPVYGRGSAADIAGAGFERFGIVDPSPRTVERVTSWIDEVGDMRGKHPVQFTSRLLQLLALTPEAQLA